MNIEERKNNKLIFRLIELSDLVNGRDNLQNEGNKLIEDIMKIESAIIECVNDFNNTVNSIRKIEHIDIFLNLGHRDCGYEGYYEKDTFFRENLNRNYNYSKVLCTDFKNLLYEISDRYTEVINSIPKVNMNWEVAGNYFKLSKMIFKRENSKLVERYNMLYKEVLQELSQYKLISESIRELEENDIGISNNMLSVIEKENSILFLNELKRRNEKTISDIRNKIDKITKDIEREFISLIPKKYIFNENFRNYAIECLFYERCNTVGEIINLYENFELHTEANITLHETLNSLNNFQAMQFHMLMEIKDSIEYAGESIADALNSGFDNISSDIKDLSYTNKRLHNDMVESNNNISRKIESSNLLALQQLDNLSTISEGTRKIGKDIYEVKDFTDRYRISQLAEGKYI